MPRIVIKNLPTDIAVSEEELARVKGGIQGGLIHASTSGPPSTRTFCPDEGVGYRGSPLGQLRQTTQKAGAPGRD
jgi:hypothetical protein